MARNNFVRRTAFNFDFCRSAYNVNAELVKYAPTEVHQEIAEILNTTARTGKYPIVLKRGILTPLPKPVKKKGPVANLRPIILLSTLRKILTICLLRRTWDRISSRIDKSQAAYQPGRGGTEQVLAVKLLCEKAISSSDYKIYLLLLDMSKAFDTINRNQLLHDLSKILDPDELHLMAILIEDVKLQVRIGSELGEEFLTEEGACQGDVLSAIFFILYLGISVTPERKGANIDHAYAMKEEEPEEIIHIPPASIDHTYDAPEKTFDPIKEHDYAIKPKYAEHPAFEIDPKYADDVTWATTDERRINQVKQTIPKRLKKRQLMVNEDKTEEFVVKRKGNESWKKCKLLGSLLATIEDIERRKALTNAIMNTPKLKAIFRSRVVSEKVKIRVFNCYMDATFLFNSETWGITEAQGKKIDAFQRRKLRQILNIKWPKVITNHDLYRRTKVTKWSTKIRRRRLNLLGHAMRLPEETPVRKAIEESLKTYNRPRGAPPTTWIGVMKKELSKGGIHLSIKDGHKNQIQTLVDVTGNRQEWRKIINVILKSQ